MQVTVETGEGLERRMRIELPFEEIEAEMDRRLKKRGNMFRVPGFRPGKIPLKILRQRHGDQVIKEIVEDWAPERFQTALKEHGLYPVAAPQVQPDFDIATKRIAFAATFEVFPDVTLAPLDQCILKRPVCIPTEEDIDEVVKTLRAQKKNWMPVDRASRMGDRLIVSYVGKVDGVIWPEISANNVLLELGAENLPRFADSLIGLQAGAQLVIELTLPNEHEVPGLAGKTAQYTITIDEVMEARLPPLNPELAKKFGTETGDLDTFREDVRFNIQYQLQERIAIRTKLRVMDLLLAANPIEPPKVLLKRELALLTEQQEEARAEGKVTLPEDMLHSFAQRRVSLGILIRAIIKQHKIQVDAEKIRAMIEQVAAHYQNAQEVVDAYYTHPERLDVIETMSLESQVTDWIMNQVKVEDEVFPFLELFRLPTLENN